MFLSLLKMENHLQQNNVSKVWRGLRTISGHKDQNSLPVGDVRRTNELTLFFNRFDSSRMQSPTSAADSPTPTAGVPPLKPQPLHTSSTHHGHYSPSPTTAPSTHPAQDSCLSLSTTQVRSELRRIKAKKAAGPDGISSRVLSSCADNCVG